MSRDRLVGAAALVGGLALAFVVQVAAPVGVPLYDGVMIPDAYRYLHPPAGQAGNPTSATKTVEFVGGASPGFNVATAENPPQAQVNFADSAFTVPAGASRLTVTIVPVDPVAAPTEGTIAGNVYRFVFTDENGAAVSPAQCDNCRTMVIRAPPEATEGGIGVFRNGAWSIVTSLHAGIASMYQADLAIAGDYAVIANAAPPSDGGGVDLLLFGAIALALFFAAVAGLFWYRRRPPPVPVARLGPRRDRVPSKRRSKNPPSGRPGS